MAMNGGIDNVPDKFLWRRRFGFRKDIQPLRDGQFFKKKPGIGQAPVISKDGLAFEVERTGLKSIIEDKGMA